MNLCFRTLISSMHKSYLMLTMNPLNIRSALIVCMEFFDVEFPLWNDTFYVMPHLYLFSYSFFLHDSWHSFDFIFMYCTYTVLFAFFVVSLPLFFSFHHQPGCLLGLNLIVSFNYHCHCRIAVQFGFGTNRIGLDHSLCDSSVTMSIRCTSSDASFLCASGYNTALNSDLYIGLCYNVMLDEIGKSGQSWIHPFLPGIWHFITIGCAQCQRCSVFWLCLNIPLFPCRNSLAFWICGLDRVVATCTRSTPTGSPK